MNWGWRLINLHLMHFQSSFINGRLDSSTKNIAIISCMRKRIMPLAICMPFQLLKRRYDMRQLDVSASKQFIKYTITLRNIKCETNLFLAILWNRLKRWTRTWLSLWWPYELSKFLFLIVRIRFTINMYGRWVLWASFAFWSLNSKPKTFMCK